MNRLGAIRVLVGLARRFIGPYWKLTVTLVVLGMISALVASIQPLVLAPAMDVTLLSKTPPAASWHQITLNNLGQTMLAWTGIAGQNHASALILFTVVAYVGLAVVSSLLAYISYLLSAWVGSSAYRDLKVALSRHLMSLSMSYFVRQRTGDLVSRVTNDAGEVINSLDLAFRKMLQSGVQLAAYGFMLFRTDLRLAVAVLGMGTIHLGVTRVLRDRMQRQTGDRLDAVADVSSLLQEILLSIRVVKSFAAERFELKRFTRRANGLQSTTMRLGRSKHAEEPLRAIADAVAIGVVLVLAFSALQAGRLNVTGFVLFIFLARQTIAPASLFAQSVLGLQVGMGSARRVVEMLQERPFLSDGGAHPGEFAKELRLESVTFGYDPARPVLDGIDLEIRKGELVALVGPSGAGKSTLGDLILRLYDPTAGRVTLDGVDVRTFKQEEYRRLFGVVSQESLLFNTTVRENIAYGADTVDFATVERAARIANADEFIRSLPLGYDTLVGDRGIRLSGGQRQRIAIARAVYNRPAILVLDEATSSLDTESEQQVQSAIERVLENTTAVVIAHRLSTIQKADRIVVILDGRVEAAGPHEMLLSSSATYRRLYELQFRNLSAGGASEPTANPA